MPRLDPDAPTDPAIPRPVFVDPSGRRRRALRLVAVASAIATAGYLLLMLLAAFGTPMPPAVQLPLPPGIGAASGNGTQQSGGEPGTLDDPAAGQPGEVAVTATPRTTETTSAPAVAPTSATTTTPGRRSSRPTAPPGQSKVPTTPPGHG